MNIRYFFGNLSLKRKLIYLLVFNATIVPIILIGTLGAIYYRYGVESLFNNQISKTISDTVKIAELYLHESNKMLQLDIIEMEKLLDEKIKVLKVSTELNHVLDEQVQRRRIEEAVIFTETGIIAKSLLSFSFVFQEKPINLFEEIEDGKVVLKMNRSQDKVFAYMKLKNSIYYENVDSKLYLAIAKYVDEDIIKYLEKARGSEKQYKYLLNQIDLTKKRLEVLFLLLSLFLCVLSIYISAKFAKLVTRPLNDLISATSKIKDGDYSVRVKEKHYNDEIFSLAKAFNKMTKKIEKQHSELRVAYNSIDERIKFIETILNEISSFIIVVDTNGYITMYNDAAKKIFPIKEDGLNIKKIVPEIEKKLNQVISCNTNKIYEEKLVIKRKGEIFHLLTKLGAIVIDEKIANIVISFEDVTDLLIAQKEAAWSDVAKKIAHEIKNPLTPIKLSAERLKSKYSKQIKSNIDHYDRYLSAITRNVQHIQYIVGEFIQFARLPQAKLSLNDLNKIINECFFMQKSIFYGIKYEIFNNTGKKRLYSFCDSAQISQVINNLAKNSAESVNLKKEKEGASFQGNIKFIIDNNRDGFEISIEDNGLGMDDDTISKVSKSYFTTKKSGMGLGMSIINKILKDHDSCLVIKNINPGISASFIMNKVNKLD